MTTDNNSATVATTREMAKQIAEQKIHELNPDADFVIVDDQTVEREFGWAFQYTTRKFVETRDPQFIIPGNGPVIVMRADGKVHFLSTSVPPAKGIEEFENRWRQGMVP